ncbi:MAG: imidazole glycerol phosphate synthase subunit HisH [Phycisphaerales bacterium]|mgnify:CR=1 FL=1|nr:imidazole glycerol phosphate synthase subunit HisH [Planctomycetota bacterium]
MNSHEVVIVRTGSANLASVQAAFDRLRIRTLVSDDPSEIDRAHLLVLPGVGAFGPAMASLERRGLVSLLQSRVKDDRPTLAICLGLQLLCEASEESPGIGGLGLISGAAQRFAADVRIPQMGWNKVEVQEARVLRSGAMYFANSYRLIDPPPGWTAAVTNYGGPFVSAIERGNVVACQFHPELSGREGLDMLWRWLEVSAEAVTC